MARRQTSTRGRGGRRRRSVGTFRGRRTYRGARPTQPANTVSSYMKLGRTLLSSLPIEANLRLLFDFIWNLVAEKVAEKQRYQGAYTMLGISPGAMVWNSPLLAPSKSDKYSFPGHPISIKWAQFVIRNTCTQMASGGKWYAVFIPYREPHDASHYTKMLDMSFADVAAMPHSVVAPAHRDLRIYFKMSDRPSYCARPRELDEEIGLFIIWVYDLNEKFETAPVNSDFQYEIDMEAGCVPHIIFGQRHRVDHAADDFKIKAKTSGQVRVLENGSHHLVDVRFDLDEDMSEKFEVITIDGFKT